MPALNNAKHETFCQLVAKGETNTKAYLCCGYSKQGAAQSANKLRKKFHIQQRLSELSVTAVRVIEQKFESDVTRIVEEFCCIAFCDPGEIVDDAGNLLPLQQMPPHVRAAISSVKVRTEVDKDGNVSRISEVRFWNKNAALDSLAKYRRMFAQLMEKSNPGEFDQLSRDEICADIETLLAIKKARDAARLEARRPHRLGRPCVRSTARSAPKQRAAAWSKANREAYNARQRTLMKERRAAATAKRD